jgi:hypothetical protein
MLTYSKECDRPSALLQAYRRLGCNDFDPFRMLGWLCF